MFTSRLPKSTSARRPSNPNDGSTSLIGSNIPISVRKANLFTPQAKRSLQGGINSTSRKSFMTTDKKYQRASKPVPDRDEQIRMFENLVDLIKGLEPNFILPEARRFFSSVSTTECTRIFEFLIGQILPEFKINKLEIDVPDALAILDYPYLRTVTKSALVSITTRQAIVNLLVIFDWLSNQVKSMKALVDDTYNSPYGDPAMSLEERALICLLSSSDAKAELQHMFEEAGGESKLQCESENIDADIERLAEEVQKSEDLDEEEHALREDLEKCDKYIEEFDQYMKTKQEEKIELQQEVVAIQVRHSKISEEHEILLPSVTSENDGDIADDQINLMRIEEEIKSKASDIDVEKRNREAVELDDTIKEHREKLAKYNTIHNRLEKELAEKTDDCNKQLEDKRASVLRLKGMFDKRLQLCIEKCTFATLSVVERAEENVEIAKKAADLVREDSRKIRSIARKIKGEV